MPQKRGEVVEKVDPSQIVPDIFENWLEKQPSTDVRARSGFIGNQDTRLGEQEEEDREEDEIERTEDVHEKAHRRKRGRGLS
jgi:hypothetical protein